MPESSASAHQTALDISLISQLVLSEREARDMGWWKRMADCFHPDARIRLSWIDGNAEEFVRGSIDMAARGMRATHRVGPPVVRIRFDRAIASQPAIIDIPAVVKGVEARLSSYARFVYRIERRQGRWRIAFFDSIYMRDELVAAIPDQVVPVTSDDVAPFRSSYRLLCYLLSLTGYTPSQDLAGDDRPETSAAMIREAYLWAGIEPDSTSAID
jgi:hypothetical protein